MLIAVSRQLMHDDFEVSFDRQRFPQGTEASMDALDEVERLESVLSVFRFDSKISLINQLAKHEPVHLDDELFDLFALCQNVAADTDGAVDITSGLLWKIWGFAKRDGHFPQQDAIQNAKRNTGYYFLQLDTAGKTVSINSGDNNNLALELNFGCVGKGFALDIASRKLIEHDVDRFLFQGGLSSLLAKGSDWKIGIAHPLRPGLRLRELELNDAAVSTSGSQKQSFRHHGKRYSHIIDPRTGEPASGVLQVTVLVSSDTTSGTIASHYPAALAELLSTAFFVLGAEETQQFVKNHREKYPDIRVMMCVPSEKTPHFEEVVIET
ncbi:FAD:protein FMN transferase [Planctomycetales bacterium]|nr:FAD:protein FMN transferase [Planctomycetales bacterium]